MSKILAIAILSAVLLFFICAKENKPLDAYRENDSNKPYNPPQTGIGKEFLDSRLQSKSLSGLKNELPKSLNYDYGSIWLTENNTRLRGINTHKNRPQNGVIGINYQRIEMYIGKAVRSKDMADTYLVTGKSKVNDSICDFLGEIRLTNLFYIDCDDDSAPADRPKQANSPKCAVLFAEYLFYENSAQNNTGVFSGTMECSVRTHKTKMLLDESMYFADSYSNRTFVGTWTDYKTKVSKKCIWGDHRLPFTPGFDCGDGEMAVCKEYVKYGWQPYQDGSESAWNEKEQKYDIKDKWWLKK
jgi:hypothetical protein